MQGRKRRHQKQRETRDETQIYNKYSFHFHWENTPLTTIDYKCSDMIIFIEQ